MAFISHQNVLSVLKHFRLIQILNHDPVSHSLAILGRLPAEPPSDPSPLQKQTQHPHKSESDTEEVDAPAILRIEKQPFEQDALDVLFSTCLEDARLIGSNDIYSWLFAWFSKHDSAPDAKISIICPATETHIRKYSKQTVFMVHETPEIYRRIVRPYIDAFPPARTQWVEDILSGASEADKVLYKSPSAPTSGFLIVPDMKWDLKTVGTLYLVALVFDRRIRSLRDLKKSHVPMLRSIMLRAEEVVERRWGLRGEGGGGALRFYVHYQPSYYHFHVHIVNASYSGLAGMNVGQAHLLDNLINLLELSVGESEPTLLERMTFTYGLGEQHGLFEAMKLAQAKGEINEGAVEMEAGDGRAIE